MSFAPLRGRRVVSVAFNLPGPVAARRLADLGAHVVKVEPPGGDPLATYAPDLYAELAAGMEVVRRDLKAEGAANLLPDTDVLLSSSRPSSRGRSCSADRTRSIRPSERAQVAAGLPSGSLDNAITQIEELARSSVLPICAPSAIPTTVPQRTSNAPTVTALPPAPPEPPCSRSRCSASSPLRPLPSSFRTIKKAPGLPRVPRPHCLGARRLRRAPTTNLRTRPDGCNPCAVRLVWVP